MRKDITKAKAWVVDVNMGYGHQRTAYPLRKLAPRGKVIHANDYHGIRLKTGEFGKWVKNLMSLLAISNECL